MSLGFSVWVCNEKFFRSSALFSSLARFEMSNRSAGNFLPGMLGLGSRAQGISYPGATYLWLARNAGMDPHRSHYKAHNNIVVSMYVSFPLLPSLLAGGRARWFRV